MGSMGFKRMRALVGTIVMGRPKNVVRVEKVPADGAGNTSF
jgi:hypothetical protein